jgi:hypothetical protein
MDNSLPPQPKTRPMSPERRAAIVEALAQAVAREIRTELLQQRNQQPASAPVGRDEAA